MYKNFVEILCDPVTKEDLNLEDAVMNGDDIVEGKLVSKSNTYLISNSIPRFVEDEGYSDNFGNQWKRWPKTQFESENINGPMEGHTKDMFEKITEIESVEFSNKIVLDLGAGTGRFVDLINNNNIVVAIDYSGAIDVLQENFGGQSEKLLAVQGDALMLPFKDGVFDFSYSIGVLHHTPDPGLGIKNIYRCLKEGGEFAIALYGEGSYYDFPTITLWRNIFNFTWKFFGALPPLIYTYIFVSLIWPIGRISRYASFPFRLIFPIANLPDIRWSYLDTFDSITPSYQSTHNAYEIQNFFKEAGFIDGKSTNWGSTSYKGKK